MALDHGFNIAAQVLPTPTDTPYDPPSKDRLGHSSQQGSSSPFSDFSAALFAPGDSSFLPGEQGGTDTGDDERYNARDSRRLTPNLGISFVSQIHALKKELESRDAIVGSLEEKLHESKAENEQLTQNLKAQREEVKSVRHQMSSRENDMLQALEDIAKERDSAAESFTDTRRQLEASKKKMRAQEEEANDARVLWENEKQEWEASKRKMENKGHVVEERLKTMVAEMMAVHSTGQSRPGAAYDLDEGMRETAIPNWNDTCAASRLSDGSVDGPYDNKQLANYRASRMSGLHEMGGSQMSGLSLADELEMTEDNDDDAEDGKHNIYSPHTLPEEINMVPGRYPEDKKARKVMGFSTDETEHPTRDENAGEHSIGIIEDYINLPGKRSSTSYTDSGTQYTPNPTSTVQIKRRDAASEKLGEQIENSANQSRKRVAIPSIFVEQTAVPKHEAWTNALMVSAGCQTDDLLRNNSLSDEAAKEAALSIASVTRDTRSTSTQTIEDMAIRPKSASTRLSPPLDVPVIAIHPPSSRPPSSHTSVVLPPRTRNAGCQVVIEIPRNLTSTAMQTEEVRIDKRPVKIPPRLQPSKATTKFSSRHTERRARTAKPPSSESSSHNIQSPPPLAPEDAKALALSDCKGASNTYLPQGAVRQQPKSALPQLGYTYVGDNDLASLDSSQGSSSKAPNKSRGIVADLDNEPEYRQSEIATDFSDDDDFANAAPIRKTLSKVQNSWKLVPQVQGTAAERLGSTPEERKEENAADKLKTTNERAIGPPQTSSKTSQTKSAGAPRKASSAAKPTDIRRKALVSSGIAEHAQRARSPSVPSASGKEPPAVPPPFPVPTRSSSRKIPVSASDGAVSPTPYSTSFFTARRGQNNGKAPIKRKILRKVQSAAAVPKAPERRPPPPPPSMSASLIAPASPQPVPPPQNQFILPYDSVGELPSQVTPIPQSRPHAGEASIETPSQQTSVVDAIAQTMVGEWMWKYVRKRTSFGITENPHTEFEMGRNGENGNSSGIRHRRWVWLAPYENAVIWSSKQPTSGPALLGKGGRKLAIQSVLDVKDDTPLPKHAGSQSAFDRSILILTPQRALKFTAVSRERHYIWLTALSFLSHSTRGMDDLANPPPLPSQEYQPSSREASASFRRTSVRDSIRVAQARSRPNLGAHSLSSPIGEMEQKVMQDTVMAWGEQKVASEDAAEPPQVPRVAAHARKRSNTGPRPVPLSAFHSYPAVGNAMASSSSLQAPTSRDQYDRFIPRSRGASVSGPNTLHSSIARRTTDPSRDSYIAPPPVVPDNFFDPAGTMRMEAFVVGRDENESPDLFKTGSTKVKKESRSHRTRQGRKKDLSYWGVMETAGASGGGSGRMREEDLFTGF